MRLSIAAIVEDLDRAVALLPDEHRDRHAPGALARDHPVGAAVDHAGDAVLARGRDPLGVVDRFQRAIAQGVVLARNVLIHRNEPLRRVAEDHRLLRAPGMRILVLEAAARDDVAGLGQRLDHRVVGVALLALVVDHALAGEARHLRREGAVLVDGVGNVRFHATRFEFARIRGPDFKVLAAMSRARCGRSRCRYRR